MVAVAIQYLTGRLPLLGAMIFMVQTTFLEQRSTLNVRVAAEEDILNLVIYQGILADIL